MEVITQHSLIQASDTATILWALASAQYPQKNQPLLDYATANLIQTLDVFALNARRVFEYLPKGERILMNSRRWEWEPSKKMLIVNDFQEALNHIIHAKVLKVGFEKLPSDVSIIDGGALVIPYVLAKTDRRKMAYIDPFSISHAYFYKVLLKIKSYELASNN